MLKFFPQTTHSWATYVGSIQVELLLSSYESGQPRLDMVVGGEIEEAEELTIEVPGFDLRSFDADYQLRHLHMVFRSDERVALFVRLGLVIETPHVFRFRSSEIPALHIVAMPTPRQWGRIRLEAVEG